MFMMNSESGAGICVSLLLSLESILRMRSGPGSGVYSPMFSSVGRCRLYILLIPLSFFLARFALIS